MGQRVQSGKGRQTYISETGQEKRGSCVMKTAGGWCERTHRENRRTGNSWEIKMLDKNSHGHSMVSGTGNKREKNRKTLGNDRKETNSRMEISRQMRRPVEKKGGTYRLLLSNLTFEHSTERGNYRVQPYIKTFVGGAESPVAPKKGSGTKSGEVKLGGAHQPEGRGRPGDFTWVYIKKENDPSEEGGSNFRLRSRKKQKKE